MTEPDPNVIRIGPAGIGLPAVPVGVQPEPAEEAAMTPVQDGCPICKGTERRVAGGLTGWHDQGHPERDIPSKLAIDAAGYVWRVFEGHGMDGDDLWSMAPQNPDNAPIPGPVTYYAAVPVVHPEPGDRAEALDQAIWDLHIDDLSQYDIQRIVRMVALPVVAAAVAAVRADTEARVLSTIHDWWHGWNKAEVTQHQLDGLMTRVRKALPLVTGQVDEAGREARYSGWTDIEIDAALSDFRAEVAGLRTQLAEAGAALSGVIDDNDRLAGQVAAIRALPDRQPCTCRDDTPVGIGHHARRRGYNEALAAVRAALVASSPTTPEAPK